MLVCAKRHSLFRSHRTGIVSFRTSERDARYTVYEDRGSSAALPCCSTLQLYQMQIHTAVGGGTALMAQKTPDGFLPAIEA
ncbi:hypothetical protein J6590_020938 [Homalodisca vitripennis]|nr:hypothetical protein J6590_020938 [Homalodisca vitripennis]